MKKLFLILFLAMLFCSGCAGGRYNPETGEISFYTFMKNFGEIEASVDEDGKAKIRVKDSQSQIEQIVRILEMAGAAGAGAVAPVP